MCSIFFKIYFMCTVLLFFFCMHVCASHGNSAKRGQNKASEPRNWNYRPLWAIMWVFRVKPGLPARADSDLTSDPSLQHYYFSLIILNIHKAFISPCSFSPFLIFLSLSPSLFLASVLFSRFRTCYFSDPLLLARLLVWRVARTWPL